MKCDRGERGVSFIPKSRDGDVIMDDPKGHKQIWNQSGGPQRRSGAVPQWGSRSELKGTLPPDADDILLIRPKFSFIYNFKLKYVEIQQ